MLERKPRPQRFLLPLYRLPVWVYRLGLGWLLARPILGHWFMMLSHQGRNTGKIRRTVVEIAHFDETRGEYLVFSGYGAASGWYRNLKAAPFPRIQIGHRRYQATCRFLSEREVYEAFVAYEKRSPQVARMLPRHLGMAYNGSVEQRQLVTRKLRLVAFRPTERL